MRSCVAGAQIQMSDATTIALDVMQVRTRLSKRRMLFAPICQFSAHATVSDTPPAAPPARPPPRLPIGVGMQDASTLRQYAPGVDPGDLVDGLGQIFARYRDNSGRMPHAVARMPYMV